MFPRLEDNPLPIVSNGYSINDFSGVIEVIANCCYWSDEVFIHLLPPTVSGSTSLDEGLFYLECPFSLATVCVTLHFYYIYYKLEKSIQAIYLFVLAWFVSTHPLRGKQINSAVLLTDYLYPMMEHFYPDGCGFFQDDSESICNEMK